MNPADTFSMIPNSIMRRRDLSSTAKLLFARLLQYRGNNHVAWPGINTLAVEIGITGRRVITHIEALEEAKLLHVEKRAGYRGSNRYHLLTMTSDGSITSDGNITTDGSITMTSDGSITSLVMETSPKENKKRSGKKTNNIVGSIPDSLNSPEFLKAWEEWKTHRCQKRKPLTPLAAEKEIAHLAEIGITRAVAAINHSIRKGWQGIFEERSNGNTTSRNRVVSDTKDKYANVGTTL